MPKGLLSTTISPEILFKLHRLKEEQGINVSRVVEEALQAYFSQGREREGKSSITRQEESEEKRS